MNSKRIVSMIGAAAVAASMALSSLPVCAAVTTMPDGGQFDAAYYAATYPDVAAALGTDANALYQHYKTFGVKEGRLPYAAGTAAATTTAPSTQMPAAVKKAAQKILNQYRTKDSSWDNYRNICYFFDKNPYFIITDQNNDGVYELYISADPDTLRVWDFYTINSNGSATYIDPVSAYNAAQNLYIYMENMSYTLCTLDNGKLNMVIAFFEEGGSGIVDVVYNNGVRTQMSSTDVYAIINTFTPIGNLAQAKALTKANINAIK